MYKIWRVAWTEYLNAVRSKAFIIGIVLLPILMGGGAVVQHLVKSKVDIKPRRFVVVDREGRFFSTLEMKAQQRNGWAVFEWNQGRKGRQLLPLFVPEKVEAKGKSEDALGLELSERVRKKELVAYIVIGKDVLNAEPGGDHEIRYFTESPTYRELPDWLEGALNEEIRRIRLESAGFDLKTLQRLDRKAEFKNLGLVKLSETGEVKQARETDRVATFLVPVGSMMLLFMLVMSSAPILLNTVLEEKLQKIAELLVSALSPFQLLMGKLLGAAMVSLTLSGIYLGAIAGMLARLGLSDRVPVSLYLWFLLFQLLALLIFGSIFSAVGAACSELRDSQNMMFPAMMLVMIPMFVWMPVLQSPTSVFAKAVSLFPPATPMLMMLRIAIPPGPAWWEIALGVALTTLFMIGTVWGAAKIFRIGILSHGQSPSFAKLIAWALSK